ncbi:MAG: hypothetical protein AAFP83_06240 [Bacteroidota bacterium]
MRGPMDLWTYGSVDLWTCGPVDLWTCGPVDQNQISSQTLEQNR